MSPDLRAAFESLPRLANEDRTLERIGRHCETEMLLERELHSWHLLLRGGRIAGLHAGPRRMRAWTFAIRAPERSWQRFWATLPPVGYQDIFAMARFGHARIEGDIGPLLKDLRFIKAVLALPRGTLEGAP